VRVRIDGQHLVAGAHIKVQARRQAFGCLEQQTLALGNLSTNVVRKAAVGKRDEAATLQHYDLSRFIEPPCPRGGRRSGCNSPNNNDLHGILPFSRVNGMSAVRDVTSDAIPVWCVMMAYPADVDHGMRFHCRAVGSESDANDLQTLEEENTQAVSLLMTEQTASGSDYDHVDQVAESSKVFSVAGIEGKLSGKSRRCDE